MPRTRPPGDPDRSRRGPAPAPGPDVQGIRAGPGPRGPRTLAGLIKAADAFIIVSGEYNHSIPPALSNLLDHFLEEYFWRPSAIVCYSAGAFGGVRAAMQLRAMLCELGTPSIPSLLPVPKVQDAFDEEGRPRDEAIDRRAAPFSRRAGMVRQCPEGRSRNGRAVLNGQRRLADDGEAFIDWPCTSEPVGIFRLPEEERRCSS